MKQHVIFFILILPFTIVAQKVYKYPFPAPYNEKSAQGMAIFGNSLFLLNNGGHCRIYNLKNRQMEAGFELGSAGKENHCNCASFGVDFPEGNREFPAFYVSECYGERRCFVESITSDGSQLIQVLKIRTGGPESKSFNWVVGRQQKCLYTISRPSDDPVDSTGTKIYLITKLPLPSLDRKEVIFTSEDIIEQFSIAFPNLSQGASVFKDFLYLPVGRNTVPGMEKRKDEHRDIIVVNLKTRKVEKTIDVHNIVDGEPEDIDFYGNNLLFYCGQKEGGVYNLNKIYR